MIIIDIVLTRHPPTTPHTRQNNLLRFGAKGHLLHAALCALCYMPPSGVRDRLERYKVRVCGWVWGVMVSLSANERLRFAC